MEPWLTPLDFEQHIGDIPVTFDYSRHVTAIVRRVVDTWLTELVGADRVVTLRLDLLAAVATPPVALPVASQTYMAVVRPFLCCAAWSEYILRGNVSITDTGPVTKFSTATEPISDTQRSQLSRFYHGLAETYALAIGKLSADTCTATNRSRRPSLKSAGGKKRSRFDTDMDYSRKRYRDTPPDLTAEALQTITDSLSARIAANELAISGVNEAVGNRPATIVASTYANALAQVAALPVNTGAIVTIVADDSVGNAGTGLNGTDPTTFYLYYPGIGLRQQVTYPV